MGSCVDNVFHNSFMNQRAEHLHIRTSEREKAILSQAAQSQKMSVSQFILRTTLPIAEEILNSEVGNIQTLFRLDPDAWSEFNRLLDAPPRENPELRSLLRSKAPWEK